MRPIIRWVRTTFGFSRSEARAFTILLPLIFVIMAARPLYDLLRTPGKPVDYSNQKLLDSLLASMQKDPAEEPQELFPFDPNTATASDFERLGLKPSIAASIVNYRYGGGKFRIKKDLRKIYRLDSMMFVKLEPWIQLPDRVATRRDSSKKTMVPRLQKPPFDLNTADTIQLKEIYGIGSVTARRIIRYRESLGGFVKMEQLAEVWGLDSTVVARLASRSMIAPDFLPRPLPINRYSEAELAAHPYIRHKLARILVSYRLQHGKYDSVDDLRKVAAIDDHTFVRIKPYITLE